ncbi:MAG: PIN domain-containing protein [Acidobacteria bacterium]|nr:MAG: PIN domain-containing protein [Acidobacteriota bacterium]REK08397.1 MAG: PIN domain-containing protein [Acidobacteriota bacterium]
MKKPRVVIDLSVFLEALLSADSDSSRLLRRWLQEDAYQALMTPRGLRALEGAVLDEELLGASGLEENEAKRWVAALALRVETVEPEVESSAAVLESRTASVRARARAVLAGARGESPDREPSAAPEPSAEESALAALSALDRDAVLAARQSEALIVSTDPALLESRDLGVDVLTPTSLLQLLEAL